MHHRHYAVLALLASASFGCSGGKPVDIGEDAAGAKLADYAANWDGYAENYNFASGSDRVRVSLDANGRGRLEVGADVDYGTPQADVGYAPPPNGQFEGLGPPRTLFEGYPYSIVGAQVQADRLQFGADGYELFKPWCELQTGYSNPGLPYYTCDPGTQLSSVSADSTQCTEMTSSGSESVDCYKWELCAQFGRPCTCSSSSCTVDLETSLDETENLVDVALTDAGNSLTGTLVLLVDDFTTEQIQIYLVRQ
ncbi:MAG TPA: hypothetical protein VMI54_01055 [Polyangiaceae bacterium]|nr:hypothetical protein [Polyangiaceae bacterium]